MSNLAPAGQIGNPENAASASQVSGFSLEAQARPRWELVQELKKAARGTSAEFHRWWWGLPKAERLALLDAEVAAA